MRLVTLPALALALGAATPPAPTLSDSFVGKWRLDVSRSTIVDDMRVQHLGRNRYAFNFEGGPTETIVADGTDQPGLPGTTLAITTEGARTLHVVRKQDGHVIVEAAWKLSPDGRTLRDSFTSQQADGTTATTNYLYRRMGAGRGFAGFWESTTNPVGLSLELTIQPFLDTGLSFVSPGSERNLVFDGREHRLSGGNNGRTISGKRRGARVVETTEKDSGKVQRSRRFELSLDGRTLTETLRTAGQPTPEVLVFERE